MVRLILPSSWELRPTSQSNKAESEFLLYRYYERVLFPVFLKPIINKESLLRIICFGRSFHGYVVYSKIIFVDDLIIDCL